MIPTALPLAVLALAAWRTYRLVSLDDFPPLLAARNWFVGARFGANNSVSFTRPLLADFLACEWCSGLWWSAGWYAAWLEWPRCALYAAAPLALNCAWAVLQSALAE